MNAQMNPINALELSVLTNGFDLSTLVKAAEPIKSPEERRIAWLRERLGMFTASEFYRLMAYPNKAELPKGAMTYASEKAVECLIEDPLQSNNFVSYDMQWGLDHELDAINAFEQLTGLSVTATGSQQQLIHLNEDVAATPDGLIGEDSGIEIKCPQSVTHLKHLNIHNAAELKAISPQYYWQIQGLLYVSKRQHWFFVSYDPRFKQIDKQLHLFKIEPNPADQGLLEQRLALAIEYRNKLI